MGSVVNFYAPNYGLASSSATSFGASLNGFVEAASATFFQPGEDFADIIAAEQDDDSLSSGSLAGIIVGSVLAGILVLILLAIMIAALTGAGGSQRFQGSGPTGHRENVDA
eukprot:CAMPEP_0177656950 /NCGR_PEP_ID=MMETSP0447-20121125/15891_1 /TAXON_ID=0 /ORGANISM="Stygamoeba regulata, Strain BSH-02190019" /LENGTH=110 /DNA_ID=CAMNT_0019161205 /DNA_START=150 /DNA_END=482 /DNA_ORIENTATION=-